MCSLWRTRPDRKSSVVASLRGDARTTAAKPRARGSRRHIDSPGLDGVRTREDRSIDLRYYGDGPVEDDFEALVAFYRRVDPAFRAGV